MKRLSRLIKYATGRWQWTQFEKSSCFRFSVNLAYPIKLVIVTLFLLGFSISYASSQILNGDLFNASEKVQYPSLEIVVEVTPSRIINSQQVILKIWGRINEGYHIYSIIPQGEFGPEPTQLFIDSKYLRAISELEESETVVVKDMAFEVPLKVHKYDFWLRQIFTSEKNLNLGKHIIEGSILYQICNTKICSFPISKDFNVPFQLTD